MVKLLLTTALLAAALVTGVSANAVLLKRTPSCTIPTASTTSSLASASVIVKGKTFDGKNVRYDRGSGACKGQTEGGDKDAVFILEEGATLKNVIIGKDQAEGIHCLGFCTIQNVYFEDVCEDAITVKGADASISGSIFKNAAYKVVQHNGSGTVTITDVCVQTAGKVYRSCGNCSTQNKRAVVISNIIANNVKVIAGVNANYGDTAKISGLTKTNVQTTCEEFEGNNTGKEPTSLRKDVEDSTCQF